MQIARIKISNYRNLDNVKVEFDPKVNFLIGENDLGKSNLLHLLDTLFNRRCFSDDDFLNKTNPIRIDLSLCLSSAERGVFEDHFDITDNNLINIYATQDFSDLEEEISFFWKTDDANEPIKFPQSQLKKLNYLIYDSLKTPQEELTFYKGRGSGKFLSFLINECAEDGMQFEVDGVMAPMMTAIQSIFDRVKPLKRQGLGLYTEQDNSLDFAARALKLNGRNGHDILKSGYGVQFSSLLLLSILERLVRLKQNKRHRHFEEIRSFFTENEYSVFEQMYLHVEELKTILAPITRHENDNYFIDLNDIDLTGLDYKMINHIKCRKRVSIVLGLDEPEIHLHPYMQRNLIKYICGLFNNSDTDFLFLLKKYFDIDAIDGQVFIASHSPSIIFEEYCQIIRFYKTENIHVISGSALTLTESEEKHLLMNFSAIKEAFFSRCVILVEGATEQGAIPLWAIKHIGDLDELGILVLPVNGKNSIPPTMKLLNHFNIQHVSIIDKDINNDIQNTFSGLSCLSFTTFRDFEEELYQTIHSTDANVELLFNFLRSHDTRGLTSSIQKKALIATATTYSIAQTWDLNKSQFTFEEMKRINDLNLQKSMFLSWLTSRKTIITGRGLGQYFEIDSIPTIYKDLFEQAKAKVLN